MKQKYRLTLPCDFGDGVVHLAGEEVELDEKKAKDYAHALIAADFVPKPKVHEEGK